MKSPIVLRGSSWDHSRGHAPMLATAAEYQQNSAGGVQIEWTPRSLKAFGSASVEELALQYDLVLVDHPHIGSLARSRVVLPLDEFVEASALAQLAERSPGSSHQSYAYDGHQWALAVDAACQVAAWRPDLITDIPRTWDEVLELAGSGRVLWPLCDVDAVASFFSLIALNGGSFGSVNGEVIDRAGALGALHTMRQVAEHSDQRCTRMNPIDVLEEMSSSDTFVYSPLLFGYVNYSRADTRGAQIMFGSVPMGQGGAVGALLGGVGIAVSASSAATEKAVDYARYVASPDTQRTIYFSSGGQPAHHTAWADVEVDRLAGKFFSSTRSTIDGAWTRPRYPGFAEFQNEMMVLFTDWFSRSAQPEDLLDELDSLYSRSLAEKYGTDASE